MSRKHSPNRTWLRAVLGVTVLIPMQTTLGCERPPSPERAREWVAEDHDNFEESSRAGETPVAPPSAAAPGKGGTAAAPPAKAARPPAAPAGKGR